MCATKEQCTFSVQLLRLAIYSSYVSINASSAHLAHLGARQISLGFAPFKLPLAAAAADKRHLIGAI